MLHVVLCFLSIQRNIVLLKAIYLGVLLKVFYSYLPRFDHCTLVHHKQYAWFYACCLFCKSAKLSRIAL